MAQIKQKSLRKTATMVFTIENAEKVKTLKCSFDDALDLTGFGKYNVRMVAACCLLILAMYLDIFGFSVAMPAAACDLELSTSQQGVLSAVPLIGVMISSYAWGLCADTQGRRWTLLLAMPIGVILNIAASFAPTYVSLTILKLFSATFTSSANAAAFVLVGESAPRRHRSRIMFIMASATMFVQLVICLFALPIFQLTFKIPVSWLSLELRPWRLLMLIISFPGVFGIVGMIFLYESPKYLLSQGHNDDALEVMKDIFSSNMSLKKEVFPVSTVFLEESTGEVPSDTTFLRKIWRQTAPLFKPPLLKNSLILYYILLCAYMTSTGYTMWIPTMTNAYFASDDDKSGQTFCQVASRVASSGTNSSGTTDCNNVIQPLTLYAVMCQSAAAGTLTIFLSFLVPTLGKRCVTLLVFSISATCGTLLLFVRVPMLSIALFYVFLYVALILGNVNTFLVELNPTHLRGMATSLSVVVARGFGFFSVQLIAELLGDYCTPMVGGYVALVTSGLLVSLFLPSDKEEKKATNKEDCRDVTSTTSRTS